MKHRRWDRTLSADTTGITDDDGLNDVVFHYQWLADDSEIVGATVSTYTLTSDDEGRAITVRVDFTDDASNEETLTSALTVVTSAGLELQSATVDGAMLTLTYNEVLDNLVSVPQTAFAVNVKRRSTFGWRRGVRRIQCAVVPVICGGGRGHGDGGLHCARRHRLHPGHSGP